MPSPVPILMYHRLGAVQKRSVVPAHYVGAGQFDRHLKLIKALGKTPITLSRLRSGFRDEIPLPEKPIVITFDDGYQSFLELGFPRLRAHSFPATVFLVSGCVGKKNEWDLAIGDVEETLMDRTAILLAASQGIEFGSHTINHVKLPEIGKAAAVSEIADSKRDLEELVGQPVDFFCYPYGKLTDEVRDMVEAAGYLGATTVKKGLNTAQTDPFQWARINVRSTTSTFQLAVKLWRAKPVAHTAG